MTRRFLFVCVTAVFALLVGCVFLLGNSHAQEIPQPTEHHQMFKQEVGDWEAEIKSWPQGPDGDPLVSKGKESNRMLGGMWLVSDFEGVFGEMKFSGHGQFGYDPSKKKYVGTWIDSMSPYVSNMEGDYDKTSKTLTMMMEGKGPSGEVMKGKTVSVMKDKNTRVFTMYGEMDGKMAKMMEITYRRKK